MPTVSNDTVASSNPSDHRPSEFARFVPDHLGKQQYLESEVGRRHAHCSVSNFTPQNDSQRLALSLVTGQWWDQNRFLIFTGDSGRGKTHLAVAAFREVQNAGYTPAFETETNLLYEWRRAAQTRIPFNGLERLLYAPAIVLDDVGTAKATDGSIELIHHLLNSRYKDEGPTILTTNLSLEELERRWGEKHISRMLQRGLGRAIHVEGTNYRLRSE